MYRDNSITHAHRDSKNCAIPACHRDNSLLKNGTRNRMATPVTQTPSTAEPLGLNICYRVTYRFSAHFSIKNQT